MDDEEGEIALCTPSAFNLGAIEKLEDLEEMADLAVRALDALLDYQDYPLKAAMKGSMNRRTLGIGVINYAYYLAKNGARYSDGSGLALTHRTFEAIQYYLLKASVLAREFGPCPAFNETTYAQGSCPSIPIKGSGQPVQRAAAPGLGSAARGDPHRGSAQLHPDSPDAERDLQPDLQRHQRHRAAARPGVGQGLQGRHPQAGGARV